MMPDMHQVRDGPRLITFEGELLGAVSSRRVGASRWTEMQIFKTIGEQYVLEKVGKSVVTHNPGCKEIIGKLPRFQEAHPGADPDEGFEYHECVPEQYDFTQLLVEEDRYWATITSNPDKIVDALYRKRDGARHLPRVSLELLLAAEAYDDALAASWRIERIS